MTASFKISDATLAHSGRALFFDATTRIHAARAPKRLVVGRNYSEEFYRAFLLERNRFFRQHAKNMERTFSIILRRRLGERFSSHNPTLLEKMMEKNQRT